MPPRGRGRVEITRAPGYRPGDRMVAVVDQPVNSAILWQSVPVTLNGRDIVIPGAPENLLTTEKSKLQALKLPARFKMTNGNRVVAKVKTEPPTPEPRVVPLPPGYLANPMQMEERFGPLPPDSNGCEFQVLRVRTTTRPPGMDSQNRVQLEFGKHSVFDGAAKSVLGPLVLDKCDAVPKGTKLNVVTFGPGVLVTRADTNQIPEILLSKKETAQAILHAYEKAVIDLKDLDTYILFNHLVTGHASVIPKNMKRLPTVMRAAEPLVKDRFPAHDHALLLIRRGEAYEAISDTDSAILDYFDAFCVCRDNPDNVAPGMTGLALNCLGIALKRRDLFDAAEACYRLGLVHSDVRAQDRFGFMQLLEALSDARGNSAAKRIEKNVGGLQHQMENMTVHAAECYNCGYPTVNAERRQNSMVGGHQAAKKLKQCSSCKAVLFCSRECQTEAWPEHKEMCLRTRALRAQANAEEEDGDEAASAS